MGQPNINPLQRIFRTRSPRHDLLSPHIIVILTPAIDLDKQDTGAPCKSRCESAAGSMIFLDLSSFLITFKIVLLGDADAVVKYLCSRLRWKLPGLPTNNEGLPPEPERVADRYVNLWLSYNRWI